MVVNVGGVSVSPRHFGFVGQVNKTVSYCGCVHVYELGP